jgi:hypothetical protein
LAVRGKKGAATPHISISLSRSTYFQVAIKTMAKTKQTARKSSGGIW